MGRCDLTPTSGDGFEISVAVFPDTEDSFTSFLERHTAEPAPSGAPLWTDPEAVSGLGEIAYSCRSPEGGFDNVWVFANGYGSS